MSQDIVKAMNDLYGNVSFGGGGGGGGGGGFSDRHTTGVGGYSDGGNWFTALDLNDNGSLWDEAGFAASAVGAVGAGAIGLTAGAIGMISSSR
jgi:hypothetical protein